MTSIIRGWSIQRIRVNPHVRVADCFRVSHSARVVCIAGSPMPANNHRRLGTLLAIGLILAAHSAASCVRIVLPGVGPVNASVGVRGRRPLSTRSVPGMEPGHDHTTDRPCRLAAEMLSSRTTIRSSVSPGFSAPPPRRSDYREHRQRRGYRRGSPPSGRSTARTTPP